MTERLPLPQILYEIREAFDEAVALRFGAEFGGRRLWLPHVASADHKVAQRVGLPVLEWLVKTFGHGELLVPLGPHSSYNSRIGQIRRLLQEGEDTGNIVRSTGCAERTVYRHRATLRTRRDDDQGELF
jgi:hypothetical protein